MGRMVRSRRPAHPSGDRSDQAAGLDPAPEELADLSYNQARTALDLVLAGLQARDLDVEEMAQLYRQGQAYVRYCVSILDRVEQEVLLWDAGSGTDPSPQPYTADSSAKS